MTLEWKTKQLNGPGNYRELRQVSLPFLSTSTELKYRLTWNQTLYRSDNGALFQTRQVFTLNDTGLCLTFCSPCFFMSLSLVGLLEKLCPRSWVHPDQGLHSRPNAQFFPIRTDQGGQIKQMLWVTTLKDNPIITQCIKESFILEALWGSRHLTFDWEKLLFWYTL